VELLDREAGEFLPGCGAGVGGGCGGWGVRRGQCRGGRKDLWRGNRRDSGGARPSGPGRRRDSRWGGRGRPCGGGRRPSGRWRCRRRRWESGRAGASLPHSLAPRWLISTHAAVALLAKHGQTPSFYFYSLPLALPLRLAQRPPPDVLVQPVRVPDEHPRHPHHRHRPVQQRVRPVRRRRVRPPAEPCPACQPNLAQHRPHVRLRHRHHGSRFADLRQLGHLWQLVSMWPTCTVCAALTTKYVLTCSTRMLSFRTSSARALVNVARNALVPE
jgi:hypothetical protein